MHIGAEVKVKIADTPSYIMGKVEFSAAGNMDARKFNNIYVIYSYTTPIAVFDSVKNEWKIDMRSYSVTTSRHRNLVQKAAESNEGETILHVQEDLI